MREKALAEARGAWAECKNIMSMKISLCADDDADLQEKLKRLRNLTSNHNVGFIKVNEREKYLISCAYQALCAHSSIDARRERNSKIESYEHSQ